MKKFAITLMFGALMLSTLAACGKNEEVAPENDNNTVVESESKVDASETADSVSPTESDKTEQAEQTEPSDSSVGVEPAGVAVEPPGCASAEEADAMKHYASQIYNGRDQTYINLEIDSDGNLTNYSEIVAPYRAKIAEMLSADLTVYKDALKAEMSDFAGGENITINFIDINVDKVADDDIWLYENSVADFSVGADGDIDPAPYLAGGIYGKCYLAAVYEILDQRGISRDAIESFECGFGGFTCKIDDPKIAYIYGNSRWNVDEESEVNGDYFYVGVEISVVDANANSLGYYETVVPMVYAVQ